MVLVKRKTTTPEWSLAAAVLLHVCTALDRFVWGSAGACILRAAEEANTSSQR